MVSRLVAPKRSLLPFWVSNRDRKAYIDGIIPLDFLGLMALPPTIKPATKDQCPNRRSGLS